MNDELSTTAATPAMVKADQRAQSPRGQLMPQTPEEFAYMAGVYDKALVARNEEISKLKETVNTLRQKLEVYREQLRSSGRE